MRKLFLLLLVLFVVMPLEARHKKTTPTSIAKYRQSHDAGKAYKKRVKARHERMKRARKAPRQVQVRPLATQ